jgi:SAM-dependent methyltransferase
VTDELGAWLAVLGGTDEEFVERAFRLVVRRAPDDEGGERALGKLRDGTLSRAGLLRELTADGEFERIVLLDDGIAFARAERGRPRDHRGPPRPRGLHAPATSDERTVEIPWCLARYDGERRVVDVGYAFAEPSYLAGLLALGAEELVGVDLGSADVPGLRGVVADVRTLPFEDGSFDLALCVSTLEHVGRDNAVYEVEAPRDAEGDAAALRELRRVLARDGRLLVTVPTGPAEDLGWQVVRTPEEWIAVFERAGFLVYEDELYVCDESGWRGATAGEARAARYAESRAGAVLLAELRRASLAGKLRLAVRDLRYRDDVRRSTLT